MPMIAFAESRTRVAIGSAYRIHARLALMAEMTLTGGLTGSLGECGDREVIPVTNPRYGKPPDAVPGVV